VIALPLPDEGAAILDQDRFDPGGSYPPSSGATSMLHSFGEHGERDIILASGH
jgi:hypothetical protein